MSLKPDGRPRRDILLIEDDPDIADLIAIYLKNAGMDTRVARSLAEAAGRLAEQQPDLVICDIMLPDGEGTDWVRSLRSRSNIPVIFLSSRSETEDIVLGFELGGDDYITKPFDPDIMVVRVKARLRQTAAAAFGGKDEENFWSDGRLELHYGRMEVRLRGEELNLPTKELQLLFLMARHPGKVFSVEQLYEQIWGIDGWSDPRTVMVHIHNLRRKIEDDTTRHRYIGTVRGIGYKFVQY